MTRTLIVGDIHGCHAELLELCDRAALSEGDVLISVGDVVDRGPEPGAVIDLLRTRPNTIVLCGNHERKHVRGVFSYSQEVTRAQLGARYADDVAWMATLPYHVELDDVRVVHFGCFPGVPLDEIPEDVRAGTTSGEKKLEARYGATPWYAHYDDAIPIVFGHAVVGAEPLVIDDRVFGIDTGACHGMRLSGLVLPERTIVSVPAREDHWARVRREWQATVLAATAWDAMTFEQIDRKLRERGEVRDALGRIAAWAEALRAMIPVLREALDDEIARLEREAGPELGRIAAAHPAGSWILRRRAGRLSSAHLGCATPRDVIHLARALGHEVEEAPLRSGSRPDRCATP